MSCNCCPDNPGKLQCRRCMRQYCEACFKDSGDKPLCNVCLPEERRRSNKGYAKPLRTCCCSRFNAIYYEHELSKSKRKLASYKNIGRVKELREMYEENLQYFELGITSVGEAGKIMTELHRWRDLGTEKEVLKAVACYPEYKQYQRIGDVTRVMRMFTHCVTCEHVPEGEDFGGMKELRPNRSTVQFEEQEARQVDAAYPKATIEPQPRKLGKNRLSRRLSLKRSKSDKV